MLVILSFVYKTFCFLIRGIVKTTKIASKHRLGDGVTFTFMVILEYLAALLISRKKKACFYSFDSFEETPTTQLKL